MRKSLEYVSEGLARYKAFLHQRIVAYESSLPGTEIDQRSDSLFAAVTDIAKAVETKLHHLMARELRWVRTIQITLMILSLLLATLVALFLHRHIRQREMDLLAIHQTKDDLVQDITERKRAEKALQVSEERFRQFFANGPEYCYMVSPEGVLLDVNDSALNVLGYEKDELVGKTIKTIYAPEMLPKIKRLFAEWSKTGALRDEELIIITKDGDRRTVLLSAADVKDKNGKVRHSVSVQRDITERKEAEEALRRERKQAQEYLDIAGAIIIALDDEGKILLINQKGCEVLEAGKDELIGKDWFTNFLPENIQAEIKGVFKSLMAGEIEGVEYHENLIITARDQEKIISWHNSILADETGKRIGILSSGEDITERKRAEEALRESEEQMVLTLRGADLGTWDWNVGTGDVTFNERWAKMLGFTLDEIEPHVSTWKKLVHPDDMPRVEEVLNTHLKGKTDFYETEHRLKHKSGHWIWVLDKGKVIERDADGNPLRACGTHLDITERKRAEKLTQIQRDLVQTLSESRNLNEALSHCLNAALDATGMDAGGAYLIDRKTGCLDMAISAGLSPGFVASASHFNADSPSARLVMKGKPVYTLHHKMDVAGDKSRLQERLRAIAVIPISHEGKIIACLNIASHTLNDFPQAVRSMAETIVNQMGAAVARIQAEEALKQAHGQLELRVKERTSELSQSNRDLKSEVGVRKRIEKKLREHQNELQTLASELSLTEERERRRFAANLHDTISQNLVMAHMKLESLTVDKLPDEVSASIKQANQMVGEALESTQNLTFELSPPVLHRLGLGPAVESLGDRLQQFHGLKVELVNQGPTELLTEDLGAFLFRATRELLINVVKHAKTEHVKVTVKKIRSTIQVEVEDQGVGFVPADTKVGRRRGEGFGLFSIQERLIRLGGSLKIWSEPSQGTRIAMSAPLKTAGKTAEETRV
jgi:PAS domain S-box-containing protein